MSIDSNNQDSTPAPARSSDGVKQPYKRPVLVSLGSLRDLTSTVSGGTNADGGKKQFTGRGGLDGQGRRARD
jgi:hypothetical protein